MDEVFEPLLRDQPRAPVSDRRSSGWMLASLFAVAAAGASVGAITAVPPAGSPRSLMFMVAMVIAAVTAGSQTIRLDQRTLQPAPTLVFVVCAAMLLGPAGATLVGVAAALASSRRSPAPAIVTHAALGALVGTSTGLLAHEAGSAAPGLNITIVAALTALTGSAMWAVGVFVVSVARRTGRSHRTLSLVAEGTELVVAVAVAPALVLCYRAAGLAPALVLAAGLVALFVSFRLYRERLLGLHAELTRLSRTDPLTGAGNRRAFDELLDQELARAARGGASTGLLVIDVDHFKQINDAHGHDAGDRVLRHVCRCLTSRLRREDRLARVGGDEFAAIITDLTSLGDLQELAAALCLAVRETARPAAGDAGPSVTVSIGGASSAACQDPDGLRRAADRALYAAKARGRDCGVVQESTDDRAATITTPLTETVAG